MTEERLTARTEDKACHPTILPTEVSYPTGSLESLSGRSSSPKPSPSRIRLNIIVVGGGLGGLSAAIALSRHGHSVTVFEQAHVLGEVGAGIQIPPNSSRHLIDWGVESYFGRDVVEPADISLRRWANGEVIGLTKLVPDFRDRFGAPYWVAHRAHLHDALHRLALDLGVKVNVASRVERFEPAFGRIVLANGDVHDADLIIASDGIKSIARQLILGGEDQAPRQTGFAAYRATVATAEMRQHPDLERLLAKPGLNLWIGDMRHVMSYTISAGNSFNLVLSHPDSSYPTTWDQTTSVESMRRHFDGWDPVLMKIIQMIKTTIKWPLLSGRKLNCWVHPSSKLLIMGDAAHAMVPYMSQGAAMAVEDAAALGAALDLVSSRSQIAEALRIWAAVRIERTSQMQEASLLNGKLWHFRDGAEQSARDESMAAEVKGEPFKSSANQWSDPLTQRWAYGYDAVQAMRLAACATTFARTGYRGWNGKDML